MWYMVRRENWVKVPKCAPRYDVFGLHNLGGQKDYAHVITQDICNKFIEIKFSVGCMVFPWLRLLDHQVPLKLHINKIDIVSVKKSKQVSWCHLKLTWA